MKQEDTSAVYKNRWERRSGGREQEGGGGHYPPQIRTHKVNILLVNVDCGIILNLCSMFLWNARDMRERERRELKAALQREKVIFMLGNMLQRSENVRRYVNKYLRETGLMDQVYGFFFSFLCHLMYHTPVQ